MPSSGSYFSARSTGAVGGSSSISTATAVSGKIVTTLKDYNDSYSICPDFDNALVKDKITDIVRREVIKVLLEDPNSEIMEIAENYLVGCVEDAMDAPDKNQIIKKYLDNIKTDLTKIITERCGDIDIVIEKYLRDNNYMDFPSINSYIRYEIDNNNSYNRIKKLEDRIDVLSKIIHDLTEQLNYYTTYDCSDYGVYNNGYEKYIYPSTGRGY